MTTALIIGGLVLVGLGLVASQLIRLKEWLDRQPPVEPPPAPDASEEHRPDPEPGPAP